MKNAFNRLFGFSQLAGWLLLSMYSELVAQSVAGWVTQHAFPSDLNLSEVQMFNTNAGDRMGYVSGSGNYVARLTEAGFTLAPLDVSNETVSFETLFFMNPDTGWVGGAAGTLWLTKDGGESWTDFNHNPSTGSNFFNFFVNDLHFFTQNDKFFGWVAGSNGSILRTGNSGASWPLSNRRSDGGSITENVFAFDFRGQNLGYCVTSNGGIYRTITLGGLWIPEGSASVTPDFRAITLFSNQVGWIVGDSGAILSSASLPGDWESTAPNGLTTHLLDVAAISVNEAYVVGQNGLLLHTTDAGTTWETFDFGNASLNGISALDSDNIWIVGDAGANFYSLGTVELRPGGIVADTSLEVGTKKRIPFQTQFNSFIDFHYSTDNGVSWILRESNYPAAFGGIYDWEIPDTVSTQFRVRIRSSQKTQVQDISPQFIVFRKTLTLEKPVQNTTLTGGTFPRIEWSHENVGLINIRFQSRPNAPLEIIMDNVPADNEFYDQWEVPRINTDRSRIVIFETDGSPSDTSGAFAIMSDTSAPQIIDVSVGDPEIRDTLMITATIRDDNPTINKLFFRQGGDKTYADSLLMNSVATDQYRATIPAQKVTLRGIEYYIKSVDTSPDLLSAFWGKANDPMPIRTLLQSDTTRNVARSQPGADAKYRKISLPYEINNASISDNFGNNFGDIDKTKWGIWFWSPQTQEYIDFTGTEEFEQGTSFWLAADFDAFNTGPGQSYATEDFPILLQPEWNQIGHPFAFPVLVQDILDFNQTLPENTPFYTFENEEVGWETALELDPWKGYFIKNTDTADFNLTIPSMASSSSPHRATKTQPQQFTWRIKVLAKVDRRTDANNYAGISEQAAGEWDLLDLPEPPPAPGKYISLYFPHKDWQRFPDVYTTDFRPPVDNGAIWDFVIATNVVGELAEIKFKWIESIPEEFEVFLIDEKIDLSQNLRQNPFYSFTTVSQPIQKKLKLIVGKEDFFSQNDLQLNPIPSNFELLQNFPNPFNPATTIRYGLPNNGKVTLKIFNLLGEEIITLMNDEEKSSGYHAAVWDGRNAEGRAVASGIYIYQLRTKSFSKTKKMLLLK